MTRPRDPGTPDYATGCRTGPTPPPAKPVPVSARNPTGSPHVAAVMRVVDETPEKLDARRKGRVGEML